MAHIQVPAGVPGIVSLFQYRPEFAPALLNLAETVLKGDSPLSPGERELIATFTSAQNKCTFCTLSHAAATRAVMEEDPELVDEVLLNPETSRASDRLKSLLNIAKKVTLGGKHVEDSDIARAKANGVSEKEIHDTVLIASMFCMYNRYVEGLATPASSDPADYVEMGRMMAKGYKKEVEYAV